MRPRTTVRLGALVSVTLAAVLVGSCDGGPSAGDIVFQLVTPNQNDGAVQFKLTSVAPAALVDVAAECAGCQVFTVAVSDTEVRGVLLGNVVAGPALRVTVSDRKDAGYAATVVAVADRQSNLRSVVGYTLRE